MHLFADIIRFTRIRLAQGAARRNHSEEASQGVQRGGNEPSLVCVNAKNNRGDSRSTPSTC